MNCNLLSSGTLEVEPLPIFPRPQRHGNSFPLGERQKVPMSLEVHKLLIKGEELMGWGWLWPRGPLHAHSHILDSGAISGAQLLPWMKRGYRMWGGVEDEGHTPFDWAKLKMSEWSVMCLNYLLLCQMEMRAQTEWRYRKRSYISFGKPCGLWKIESVKVVRSEVSVE